MALYGYGNDARAIPLNPSDAMALPAGPSDAQPMPLGPDPMQGAMPQAPAWTHPEAAFAQGANPYAPRLMQNGDQWTLYEHGDQRLLQPNEVSGMQGYVTDFWNQFGGNQGNVWGTGHANDPYGGQIPFPAGVTPEPTLLDKFYPGGSAAYQQSQMKAPMAPSPETPALYQPGAYRYMNDGLAGMGGSAMDSSYRPALVR